MTIQMRFGGIGGGAETRTYTYRKVYRGLNLAEYRESFFANASSYPWGVLIQLRGKQRKMLNSFGTVPDEILEGLE